MILSVLYLTRPLRSKRCILLQFNVLSEMLNITAVIRIY